MRRALQILVGLIFLFAGWRMWRLFVRRRAGKYTYSQDWPSYSSSPTPQPPVSASALLSAVSGTAEQQTPPANDKPSEEPAASLNSPASAMAPPPAAAHSSGARAPAGDGYMPVEETAANADDQSGAAVSQANEQSVLAGRDIPQDAAAADAAPSTADEPDQPAPPDDLLAIEGIGPKISTIVVAGGITSFAELAATDVGRLKSLLHDAGIHTANPSTWPQQAQFAANGQWDELRDLQERIKNGRIEE